MQPTIPPGQEGQFESFGSYRLVWQLGQGGMAELFLALRSGIEGFEKVVALKRILPAATADAKFIAMFLDEARLAARLDHPNIVRIYDLGEIDQQYFMAMEYLPGEDLREVHHRAREAKQQVPVEIGTTIIHDSAAALQFAHQLSDSNGVPLQIVHRDVSPSNIIVTYHGAVKLVDFGIAKAATNSIQTQTGEFKGKLPYGSPEQFAGLPVDRRIDTFGLGIVFWELLTGRRLFAGENYGAIIEAVKNREIAAPSRLRPEVPPEIDRIVLRALERDRDKRYQTALEMQEDIEAALPTLGGLRTSRAIGQWLAQLFGEQRATAKKAIAQGKTIIDPIEGILKPLRPALDPRRRTMAPPGATGAAAAVTSQPSVPSSPYAATTPSPRPRGPSSLDAMLDAPTVAPVAISQTAMLPKTQGSTLAASVLAGFAGLVFAAALIATVLGIWVAQTQRPEAKSLALAPPASIRVDSDPDGAYIFLDGEPTGRVTPAVLEGLTGIQEALIRVEKSGYAAERARVSLQSNQMASTKLRLVPEGAKDGAPE